MTADRYSARNEVVLVLWKNVNLCKMTALRLRYDPGTKIVDVYVRYLRLKIDEEGAPSLIQTVRGII